MKRALRVLKFEKFFRGRIPGPLVVRQDATTDPHKFLQYHSMHLLCTQVLRCILLSLGNIVFGFFGLTGSVVIQLFATNASRLPLQNSKLKVVQITRVIAISMKTQENF